MSAENSEQKSPQNRHYYM